MSNSRKARLFLFFCWILAGRLQSQQMLSDAWIKQYKAVMDGVAKSWVQKDYAKALDGLNSARSLLSYNMPFPTDIYAWRMVRALKTYTLVMTRLIEVDLYIQRKDSERVIQLSTQAQEWANTLNEQGEDWNRVFTQNQDEIFLRVEWLDRFNKSIDRARKLYNRIQQHQK